LSQPGEIVTRSLSSTLAAAARSIDSERVTLGDLLDTIGEDSLLISCMILMVPFLFPVSVPGVSTVFSLVVMFTGAGIMMNRRTPWMPKKLMQRSIGTRKLIPALERGSRLFARLDRMCRPRLRPLTRGVATRINGAVLLAGGILLIFPLGGVPLSNTLPALSVLFIAAGITQDDGLFVLIGYAWLFVSIAYFTVLAIVVLRAGKGITEYFSALMMVM
jgi:hypothetical protein